MKGRASKCLCIDFMKGEVNYPTPSNDGIAYMYSLLYYDQMAVLLNTIVQQRCVCIVVRIPP